jgi:peptidoglycan/xylan/chitin deacetylase (PgdA/CDA1 family)
MWRRRDRAGTGGDIVRQDEASTPDPPGPATALDRRRALKAAALAIAAVPVAACQSHGHGPVTSAGNATVPATAGGQAAGTMHGAGSGQGPATVHAPAATGTGHAAPPGSGAAPTATPRPTATPQPTPTARTGSRQALPPEVTNGPRDRPNVALTFHGQGDPTQVRALLDELEKGGARVTVLAVGSWLQTAPDIAKRILDGGHELGNHTQNHADLASLSAADAFDEINGCAAVLRRLTGSIGTWFRPSQTQHATATIRTQATRVGYATCLSYDLDSLDNTDPGATAVVRTVSGSVRGGSIVSMHCGHAGTVAAIPAILERLRQVGLRPVTVSEMMRP